MNRAWPPLLTALVTAGLLGGVAAAARPRGGHGELPAPAVEALLVSDGDTVRTTGYAQFLPDGSARLCMPVTAGPCLTLYGAAPDRLNAPARVDGLLTGGVTVTGVYRDGTVTVVEQTADRPARLDDSDPELHQPPCRPPAGGWTIGSQPATGPLRDHAAAHADVIGGVLTARPNGRPSGAEESSSVQVQVVGVLPGHPAVEAELRRAYPGNLCLVPATVPRSRLAAALSYLAGLHAPVAGSRGTVAATVDSPLGRGPLTALVSVPDRALLDRLAGLSPDDVAVWSWLRRVSP